MVEPTTGTPPSVPAGNLTQVRDALQDILGLSDDDALAIDYMTTLAIANTWHKDPEPVWGYLVGPPGSAKTEILRTLDGWKYSKSVDELTENALASGANDENGEDHSLLPQLNGKLFVIKDFTTVMGANDRVVEKVLSVLRAAYDGSYSKASAKEGQRSYTCKFGMLAAVTPVIDQFLSSTQKLGERFVLLRLQRNGTGSRRDRTRQLRHVRSRMENKAQWRASLRLTVQTILSSIRETNRLIDPSTILVSETYGERLDNIADLVCRLRTTSFKGQTTEAEAGSRLVQQLTNLAKARAMCDQRSTVNEEDLNFVARIAEDTMPRPVHNLFALLYKSGCANRHVTADQLSSWTSTPVDYIHEMLRQYHFLGIAEQQLSNNKRAWKLSSDTLEQAHIAALFPQTTNSKTTSSVPSLHPSQTSHSPQSPALPAPAAARTAPVPPAGSVAVPNSG